MRSGIGTLSRSLSNWHLAAALQLSSSFTQQLRWCVWQRNLQLFLHHNSLAGALSKAIANVAVLDLTENSRHYWCLYS